MTPSDVDFRDIQGLVRFGHGHLTQAHFYLLNIIDAAAARAWLSSAPVTTAVKNKPPPEALQVAFTRDGLEALGVSKDILADLSYEFRSGMNEGNRSRRLGDINASHPDLWQWGGPGNVPHVLVMVYATGSAFDDWDATIKGQLWSTAFSELKGLATNDIGDIEPFGFVDGTSQPELDWNRKKPDRLKDTTEYTNLSALGEFLLGYPNEYGRYTDRPLLDAADDPANLLPLAEDVPGKKDFGRNGTYLVLRDLSQDVPGFWQFVDRQAARNPAERRKLARAMVGRMPPDTPVVPSGYNIVPGDDPGKVIPPGAPIAPLKKVGLIDGVGTQTEDIWLNQFTYHDDPNGTACPYGAHIRRANPRNADLPEGTSGWISRLIRIFGFGGQNHRDDLLASTRFHRILRRGREYGPSLKPDQAVQEGAEVAPRGLQFICLNANISRQFEFIQSSWLENPKFNGLDEVDPVAGNRAPFWTGGDTNRFSIPRDSGLCRRVGNVPQFVTVRGGAYFFMPGISALRYLAHRR